MSNDKDTVLQRSHPDINAMNTFYRELDLIFGIFHEEICQLEGVYPVQEMPRHQVETEEAEDTLKEEEDGRDSVSFQESNFDSNDDTMQDTDGEYDASDECSETVQASPVQTSPSTSRGQKRQLEAEPKTPAVKKRAATVAANAAAKETADSKDTSHLRQHKMKLLGVTCPQAGCIISIKSNAQLRKHLLVEHQIKPYQCWADQCSEQFDRQSLLIEHNASHDDSATTWVCPHCQQSFPKRVQVRTHISEHHQNGQFQCTIDQCNAIITTRNELHQHQRIVHHSKSSSTAQKKRMFSCVDCDMSFEHRADLNSHQREHMINVKRRRQVEEDKD